MYDIPIRSSYLICEAIAELLTNEQISRSTAKLRLSAIMSLRSYLRQYLKLEYIADLVDSVCEKKIGFIMQAETLREIQDIMRPALPEKTYNGITCRSPYHIPAEELMLWMHVSPYTKLIPEAAERCMMLFKQVFGCSVEEFGRNKND